MSQLNDIIRGAFTDLPVRPGQTLGDAVTAKLRPQMKELIISICFESGEPGGELLPRPSEDIMEGIESL